MNRKVVHKFSRADNNTVLGRRSRCGLSDFYTDKDNESKVKFEQLAHWLNKWGSDECHARYEQKENQKSYRRGYHQCIRDIMDFLKINFRQIDRRTKTGFVKNE